MVSAASAAEAGAPEISDEMIAAGLAEIDGFDLLQAWESQSAQIDLISRVYRAMHISRREAKLASAASSQSLR
jgi:hypothetical protein